MANEEETKTKRTSKEPIEIKPDPDLISTGYSSRFSEGEGGDKGGRRKKH